MIIADNADLVQAHGIKCEHYDTQSICEWIRDRVRLLSLLWCSIGEACWLYHLPVDYKSLGVSEAFLGLISFVTLGHRSWIVNHFHRSTNTVTQNDG